VNEPKSYREVWAADFEYISRPGERPIPVCLVAHELVSGRKVRLWRDQFGAVPPYPVDADSLFVSYNAVAELSCHRALGWPMPARVLDLYVEYRRKHNRIPPKQDGKSRPRPEMGLLAALADHGLDSIGAIEKKSMIDLILRGGSRTDDEKTAILDYCETDVEALARLLPAMLPEIDLPRALLRGRFIAAVAAMEHAGVPIDIETLDRLRAGWPGIQDRLIAEVDGEFGVYDGRTFKADRFGAWTAARGIQWPRLDGGRLALDDDTFKDQALIHPLVSPLRELRKTLSGMRLHDLAVGHDKRNRASLFPFGTLTGRNAPSNSKFIFGTANWLRCLIKPPPGYAVAYIDWSQQEFGIAAALSGDRAMQAAYLSGDPYLALAKQVGAVPAGATKETHGAERDLFKTCALAINYDMRPKSLATKIGLPRSEAREILRQIRQTYRRFWEWSDAMNNAATLEGHLSTVFGWRVLLDETSNPRSARNFPMQGHGGEILRLACCLAVDRGIEIAAPIHDAVLICAPINRLEADIATTRGAMAEASRIVLGGFELGTDVSITRWPDRFVDKREAAKGAAGLWARVTRLLNGLGPESR
jgi:DNA polymerase I